MQSCISQPSLSTHSLWGQAQLGALIYSLTELAFSASRRSMTRSIQLPLSAHSLSFSLMFPWSEALGSSCTCSLSEPFTKTACSLRKSSEPVRKETTNRARQTRRVRHIKNDISAGIPRGLKLSCYAFPGNSSSFSGINFFSVKEWGQV